MNRYAEISPCLKYRYLLQRTWDLNRPWTLTWCMLNPSTADGLKDDPTIRQCMGFAETWGYGGMSVINLFAYRSPKPVDLLETKDPVGPENDLYFHSFMGPNWTVVAAWGSNAKRLGKLSDQRVSLVHELAGSRLWIFGLNASGHPAHPLYIARNRPLQKWTKED